jgi:hypothetical protein
MNYEIKSFADLDEALEIRLILGEKLELLEETASSDITPELAEVLAKRIKSIKRNLCSLQEALDLSWINL